MKFPINMESHSKFHGSKPQTKLHMDYWTEPCWPTFYIEFSFALRPKFDPTSPGVTGQNPSPKSTCRIVSIG
jgi:hypothetical protein